MASSYITVPIYAAFSTFVQIGAVAIILWSVKKIVGGIMTLFVE